ncbi:MAG: ribosome-associated translation inhibitor RaiA [Planctomycetota bacterium]|nr:ribosome-associated translation inhibitor RaiA [Planctomycetota bacterium]
MELKIEGRHFKITEAIQQHVEDKIGRLDKYFDGIHRLHVILDVGNPREQKVELVCTVARRYTLVAKGEAEDLYTAIDKAEKKLLAALKKYKAKLRPQGRGSKRAEAMSTIGTLETGEAEAGEEQA